MTVNAATATRHETGSAEAKWPLIAKLRGPNNVKAFNADDLAELASEVRGFLIEHVSATGGHLGANLGVVELTIAIHRVFDSPEDVVLFDTGHQCYVHKILTGRAGMFGNLRRAGGMSGYPSRTESVHDWVESSHASSALSYADGLTKGFRLQGNPERRVVAVVGDGGLTGGLAWESLNNIAQNDNRIIIVLNDNGRSYAPTIGGFCSPDPATGSSRRRHATDIFEALGFAYIGPIDGHDTAALEAAFADAAESLSPVVVHCTTVKGKGYLPAESDLRDRMHAVGVINPRTGRADVAAPSTWTSIFAEEILRLGSERDDIVAVTAAMLDPVGLKPFADAFPDRVFDVGIAEQHAVCSAAGLAMTGLHPVVCVYSTFLSRAVDQVLMDVALHGLPVTFVLDRAGITGPDGASHHGMWDTALLSAVPGLHIASPRDPEQLRELLVEATNQDRPTAVRYPRASANLEVPALARVHGIDILYRSATPAEDVLIVSAGPMAPVCLEAAAILEARGLGVTVVDPRWIQPLTPALLALTERHGVVATVEDGMRGAGMGTALLRDCSDAGINTPCIVLGLGSEFISHGERTALLKEQGLESHSIASRILESIDDGAHEAPVPNQQS